MGDRATDDGRRGIETANGAAGAEIELVVAGFLSSRYAGDHYRAWSLEHRLDSYLAANGRLDLITPQHRYLEIFSAVRRRLALDGEPAAPSHD